MREVMHACQALTSYSATSCVTPYNRQYHKCRPLSPSISKLLRKALDVGVQTCRSVEADVPLKHGTVPTQCKASYGPCNAPRSGVLVPQLFGKSAHMGSASQVLATGLSSGAHEHVGYERQAYKDLALYGVDEADFDFMQQLPAGRQRRIHAVAKADVKSDGSSLPSSSDQKSLVSRESDSSAWLAYLLLSCDEKTTLVGVTNDLSRRLRQQNGHIKGGAKLSCAGRPWRIVCTVKGFSSKSEAFQFEWAWENMTKAAITKNQVLPEELVKGCKYLKAPAVARRQTALEHARNLEDFNNLQVEWELEDVEGD